MTTMTLRRGKQAVATNKNRRGKKHIESILYCYFVHTTTTIFYIRCFLALLLLLLLLLLQLGVVWLADWLTSQTRILNGGLTLQTTTPSPTPPHHRRRCRCRRRCHICFFLSYFCLVILVLLLTFTLFYC